MKFTAASAALPRSVSQIVVSVEELSDAVPEPVMTVCRTLKDAGHRAFAVGGAVRDVILGRNPGDWDVTTDALPDVVAGLFAKTIPTGLEHGTITVMAGRGRERMGIEVTTFRGEGTYTDARRPDSVTFGVSLTEDLARRDFVVNALAFDPIDKVLEDPFGGFADIQARVIRAVGVPLERFTEDGLRVMRAVRFVSALDFALEPKTEEALVGALDSLSKVASERVRVELLKLLAGPGRARALAIAWKHRVLQTAVPFIEEIGGDPEWDAAATRAEAVVGDPVLRLAALVLGLPAKRVETGLRALTVSNQERSSIMTLHRGALLESTLDDVELRVALGKAGRAMSPSLVALWRGCGKEQRAERAEAILANGDPLAVSELAIKGKDLIAELELKPSPLIGKTMAHLLATAHSDPALNTRDALLEAARQFVATQV